MHPCVRMHVHMLTHTRAQILAILFCSGLFSVTVTKTHTKTSLGKKGLFESQVRVQDGEKLQQEKGLEQ